MRNFLDTFETRKQSFKSIIKIIIIQLEKNNFENYGNFDENCH